MQTKVLDPQLEIISNATPFSLLKDNLQTGLRKRIPYGDLHADYLKVIFIFIEFDKQQ